MSATSTATLHLNHLLAAGTPDGMVAAAYSPERRMSSCLITRAQDVVLAWKVVRFCR